MQGTRRFVIMALASLLFAPTATAANGSAAFTAQEATLLGSTTINGTMAAFVQENTGAHDALGSPFFRLEADRLRVESDQSNASLSIGSTRYRYDPHTMIREYADATVQGSQHRPDYLFLVFPMGKLTASMRELSCAVAGPGTADALVRNATVANRPASRADTSQSMLLTGCTGSASLTLHGDLLLRLWEWDADLEAASETRSLHSGRTATQPVPDNLYAATEQYLYAHNATLHIPELSGHYQLHLDQATTTGSHSLHLRQAVVDVAGTQLADHEVRLQGDLSLDFQRSQDGLAGQVSGVEEARSDEAAWMTATTTQAPSTGAAWTAALAAAALAVAAVAAVVARSRRTTTNPASTWWQRRARRWTMRAKHAYRQKRHRRAIMMARVALILAPNAQAHIVRARSYARLGRHAAALRVHRRLHAIYQNNPCDQARNAWYALHASTNRPRQALQWLRIARRDPHEFLRLSALHPVDVRLFESMATSRGDADG